MQYMRNIILLQEYSRPFGRKNGRHFSIYVNLLLHLHDMANCLWILDHHIHLWTFLNLIHKAGSTQLSKMHLYIVFVAL